MRIRKAHNKARVDVRNPGVILPSVKAMARRWYGADSVEVSGPNGHEFQTVHILCDTEENAAELAQHLRHCLS